MWKLIVSPEFGGELDLDRLTRDMMERIEFETGIGKLEWIAVKHYNTEHPHIHIALRGIDADGRPIRFDRDVIMRGLRKIAEEL